MESIKDLIDLTPEERRNLAVVRTSEDLLHASFLSTAFSQMDVAEIPGPKHHPQILEYHQTCTMKATADEIPWCSAAVNWVVLKSGVLGTGSAAAISWEKWGQKLIAPRPGCLIVLKRGSGNQRHVGFYLYSTRASVVLISGNIGDRWAISPFSKGLITAIRGVTLFDEARVS